jgi:hypothetical protein
VDDAGGRAPRRLIRALPPGPRATRAEWGGRRPPGPATRDTRRIRGPRRRHAEHHPTLPRARAGHAAEEQYGSGERAERTAYAALKHGFEKVGDHWEPKESAGPSDAGAEERGAGTAGGVDANASKAHLMEIARRLDVAGRSRMTKDELVDGIRKANDRETRKARERDS